MQVSRNHNVLPCVDREQVDKGLQKISDSGAIFGVNAKGIFIPILKEGEKLKKEGLNLFILSPGYSRMPASARMEELLNKYYSIRWINELYFKMPGDTNYKSVKLYISEEYSVVWKS